MKYKVLYDTQIAGRFIAKDEVMDFENGTDENFINRLIANKVIQKIDEEEKDELFGNPEQLDKKSKVKAKK